VLLGPTVMVLFIGNLYLVPGTYYPVPGTDAATSYWYEGLQVGPTNTAVQYCRPRALGLDLLGPRPGTVYNMYYR